MFLLDKWARRLQMISFHQVSSEVCTFWHQTRWDSGPRPAEHLQFEPHESCRRRGSRTVGRPPETLFNKFVCLVSDNTQKHWTHSYLQWHTFNRCELEFRRRVIDEHVADTASSGALRPAEIDGLPSRPATRIVLKYLPYKETRARAIATAFGKDVDWHDSHSQLDTPHLA